jgi:small subunit ribosomal protein S20
VSGHTRGPPALAHMSTPLVLPSVGPHLCGPFFEMPNIKQQKKRVRTSAEDRVENLRYRSTVKTITRRLEAAVEAGDKDKIAAEHTQLQRWIDRAASRGAIHRNTAARKKAQAARLVARA